MYLPSVLIIRPLAPANGMLCDMMACFRNGAARAVLWVLLVQSLGIAEGRGGARGPENVWGSAATGAADRQHKTHGTEGERDTIQLL